MPDARRAMDLMRPLGRKAHDGSHPPLDRAKKPTSPSVEDEPQANLTLEGDRVLWP